MGLVLPAAWSRTPGSSPCNELVMETVTACASGKITALSTIFRNDAGTIKWKVPETEVSGKSMFQVHEARTETVKQNSSWQQQEDRVSGVFRLEYSRAEIRLHWKTKCSRLPAELCQTGETSNKSSWWVVGKSLRLGGRHLHTRWICLTEQGNENKNAPPTPPLLLFSRVFPVLGGEAYLLHFSPVSFLGFMKAPSSITIKLYHKTNVLQLSTSNKL